MVGIGLETELVGKIYRDDLCMVLKASRRVNFCVDIRLLCSDNVKAPVKTAWRNLLGCRSDVTFYLFIQTLQGLTWVHVEWSFQCELRGVSLFSLQQINYTEFLKSLGLVCRDHVVIYAKLFLNDWTIYDTGGQKMDHIKTLLQKIAI